MNSDSLMACICFTLFIAGVFVGKALSEIDVENHCKKSGEVTLESVIYECRPKGTNN